MPGACHEGDQGRPIFTNFDNISSRFRACLRHRVGGVYRCVQCTDTCRTSWGCSRRRLCPHHSAGSKAGGMLTSHLELSDKDICSDGFLFLLSPK